MKFIFGLFLFLTCFFHVCGSGEEDIHLSPDLKVQIESVSHADLVFVENFLSKLVRTEGLGYVLFGNKPICLSGYFIQTPLGNMFRGPEDFVLKKGWEVWKKYEHFFPHPNYLIFEEYNVRGGYKYSSNVLDKQKKPPENSP